MLALAVDKVTPERRHISEISYHIGNSFNNIINIFFGKFLVDGKPERAVSNRVRPAERKQNMAEVNLTRCAGGTG